MRQQQIDTVKELLKQRVPVFANTVAPYYSAAGLTWGGGFGVDGYVPNSDQIEKVLYELIEGLRPGVESNQTGRLEVFAVAHEDNAEVIGSWGMSFEYDMTRYEDSSGLVEAQ